MFAKRRSLPHALPVKSFNSLRQTKVIIEWPVVVVWRSPYSIHTSAVQ